MFASISAQPQGITTGYIWIFISPIKLHFQRIKNQVNRRFLQADMAELPKVARSEIFWTSMQERKQNGHSSLIWDPIKMNEYLVER
jgi:hypothetical protein